MIYLDLLRQDFEAGRFTPKAAEWLISTNSHPIHPDVAEPGEETCLDHDARPLQAVLDLVDGWRQTVRPLLRRQPRS